MLVWPALRLSERLASTQADRFWLFAGACMLQLGAITTLTSLLHQLNPAGWLLGQLAICLLVASSARGLGTFDLKDSYTKARAFLLSLSPAALVVLLCTCGLIILSGITQLATPIFEGDEKMYHASRVLYWIQNHAAFPYITHNDRQNMTPFGSELFFLWPVLLTKTESVARMVFWVAYPGAAIGQYWLLRSLKLSRTVALLGGLILLSTPLVMESAIGLKPEMWSVMALLGTAYWAVAIMSHPERMQTKCFLLGLFAVLSINTRPAALALLPSVAIIPFCARTIVSPLLRLRGLSLGFVCGIVGSTLLIPIGFNWVRYGHPFGPAALRHVVEADISPIQLYTHAVRIPFVLLELPEVPPAVIARFSRAGNRVISALGAGASLPLEDDSKWPGQFVYRLPQKATSFSLWGLFWIPVLGIGIWRMFREALAANLKPLSAVTLLAAPLFLATVFHTRWMADSRVPERLLIGAYGLTLPIGLAMAEARVTRWRLGRVLTFLVVAFAVYQPLRTQAHAAIHTFTFPVTEAAIDQPFQEALAAMPTGSHILFVGAQDAPDYPLFSPRAHYSNSVISWGKTPFDEQRMQFLIQSEHITHVLLQHDESAPMHWDPPVRTAEMVAWLAREPGIREIPLTTPHMRLFQTAK